MANKISVLEGAIETMRCAGPLSFTSRPSPSVKVKFPERAGNELHAARSSVNSKVIIQVLRNIYLLLFCRVGVRKRRFRSENQNPQPSAGEVGEAVRVSRP